MIRGAKPPERPVLAVVVCPQPCQAPMARPHAHRISSLSKRPVDVIRILQRTPDQGNGCQVGVGVVVPLALVGFGTEDRVHPVPQQILLDRPMFLRRKQSFDLPHELVRCHQGEEHMAVALIGVCPDHSKRAATCHRQAFRPLSEQLQDISRPLGIRLLRSECMQQCQVPGNAGTGLKIKACPAVVQRPCVGCSWRRCGRYLLEVVRLLAMWTGRLPVVERIE